MGKLNWTPHDYYTTKYAWDQFIGHIMGGFHLQHTLIGVAFAFWKFFIVFEPKKKNSNRQMRQLWASVANESTLYLV